MALAITFSPNQKALLNESKYLMDLFDAELILIHAGDKSVEAEQKLNDLITEAGLNKVKLELVWKKGDPVKIILSVCDEKNVDLLVAGALEKENFLKYYTGSVARNLMRESKCSVLLLSNPSLERKPFQKFCVNIDFSYQSEYAAKKAYEFAKLENAKEMIFIRELQLPALASTVYDSGSIEEAESKINLWQKEEEEKINLFINELNLHDLPIKKVCLYGKQGWESGHYVKSINGDLFIIPARPKKSKLFDRIFQRDQEFIFENLPCSLLIIRPDTNSNL
jgi:nucleotide-binding universal stress UspA family protein